MQRNITSLSPGVGVAEIDLTTVVPSVATSIGAFAGPFVWGPGDEIVTISNENQLVDIFGEPTDNVAEYWFSASNFLSYSSNLKIVRTLGANTLNAVTEGTSDIQIKNETDYLENYSGGTVTDLGPFAAKYPGGIGNSLSISVCPNADAFSMNVSAVNNAATNSAVTTGNTTVLTNVDLTSRIAVGDFIQLKQNGTTTNYVEVSNITSTMITVANPFSASVNSGAYINRRWKYYGLFTDAPGTSDYALNRNATNDEMHIVVIDKKGLFTGIKDAVVEKFGFISKASDAKTPEGTSNYYKNVLNTKSKYVWWLDSPDYGTNWDTPALDTNFTESIYKNEYNNFSTGADGIITVGNIESSYDKFANPENADISLIISGPASTVLSSYLIDIAESRKDVMVFVSPLKADVVDNINGELEAVLLTRSALTSSSYAVLDSGWKYQYDKYNDIYRWIPLNGDIAGLTARTDQERDPWFSPAGSNRGIIKNIVKLSWNPSKAARDDMYLKGINSVVTFPGEGTMLYGDKTLLSRPSAFDRINVRRLFIVLEKSISRASRSTLFEFNDQFTRAQFVSLVEPYLRDVKGRRGIIDFSVVCDETNNTAEVIDRNEFIGDIYIKPAHSVNYIQLNFVAVRSGVNFQEIVGQF
jgi:phage tail sheath protein FI